MYPTILQIQAIELKIVTIITKRFIANFQLFRRRYFSNSKTLDNIDFSELIKFKSILNLDGSLSLDSLSEELSRVGYKLSEWNDSKILYTRSEEVNSTTLEPNKYYLGAEEGYISIFKTDENGKVIEDEKKVYTEYKPLNNLPEIDQEAIKNNEFFFDTKDETLIKLSEMVSLNNKILTTKTYAL